MADYNNKGKIIQLNLLERRLYHFALWRWCAIAGKRKHMWPGWILFYSLNYDFHCIHQDSIHCHHNSCYDGNGNCWGGLFAESLTSADRILQNPTSWINKRAYYKICMQIATIPFKEKIIKCEKTKKEVIESLRPLYSIYKALRIKIK